MAGSPHEKCVAIIAEGLFNIRGKIPERISDRIYFLGNQDFNGFEHHYHGSEKTPDMAWEVTDNDGDHQLKFVAEVGFSESYEELVEDARMWLEGLASVVVVMLVKIQEHPPYRCPINHLSEAKFVQQGFLGIGGIKGKDQCSQSSSPSVFGVGRGGLRLIVRLFWGARTDYARED